MRLAYWDGANWTEFTRTLASGSSWNSSTTKLMFRLPAALAAAATNSNLYLYYGRAAATAPSGSVPAVRYYKVEQLTEQSTANSTFVDVPSTTLTLAPTATTETWLIFVSGVMRSSSTAETSCEMRLLINGVEVDLWGHQNNSAATPNGAGFVTFERITGTTSTQTIQPQFRAAAGTSYVDDLRVIAALVPQGADVQFAETDATSTASGAGLSLQTLTFTPATSGDYLILGKLSHHEYPGGSTVQSWLTDDGGGLHPDAPSGTHFSTARDSWSPMFVAIRRTLPASSRTFTLSGTSSSSGVDQSEWRYRRIMAFRADAWELSEYSESLGQSVTTATTLQLKNSLVTSAPPAARDYLVLQSERIGGAATTTTAQKAGELRDDGAALIRTDHHIDRDNTSTQGYHHIAGVVNAKSTASSVTYENGYLSPDSSSVDAAESTICVLRYHEAAAAVGAESGAPTVAFSSASQGISEAGGTATATITLSAASAHDVSVPFTVGGTATGSTDYTVTSSPVTITAGNTSTDVTISVTNDLVDESNETVILTIGTPTGALVGTTDAHTLTITDNDTAGITLTQSGGATAVTEGGATDSYTLVLTSQPTSGVSITVTPDSQTNLGSGAGTAITVAFTTANWNSAQTVTVTAVNDSIAEGAHNSTITHSVSSSDTNYDGLSVGNVTAAITDNDTAGITLTQSGGTTTVTEGGATDSYTLVLTSQPAADVTITLTPGADVDLGYGAGQFVALIFTASDWSTIRTISVSTLDDPLAEGPHVGTIVHTASSADADYDAYPVADLVVQITDNDVAGVTAALTSPNATTEGGGVATISVALASAPTASVTLPVASSDTTEALVSVPSVTFSAQNWNTPQQIVVTGVDDDVGDGAIGYAVTIGPAVSTDPFYAGRTAPPLALSNADDDTPGIGTYETGGATAIVAQTHPVDSYVLMLDSEPTAAVVVTVHCEPWLDLGAGPGAPVEVTFLPADWDEPRTIYVRMAAYGAPSGTLTGQLTHTVLSADPSYNGRVLPPVQVTIENDTEPDVIPGSGDPDDGVVAGDNEPRSAEDDATEDDVDDEIIVEEMVLTIESCYPCGLMDAVTMCILCGGLWSMRAGAPRLRGRRGDPSAVEAPCGAADASEVRSDGGRT